MSEQPNIVVFMWDDLDRGELGCCGGGVLRGAPANRVDGSGTHGLKLIKLNVEAPR